MIICSLVIITKQMKRTLLTPALLLLSMHSAILLPEPRITASLVPVYCHPNETEEQAFDSLLENLCHRLIGNHGLQIDALKLKQHFHDIFMIESGCNANAKSKHSSATGIMQWLSAYYATKWGYSRNEFANLSRSQQLKYVEIYFNRKLGYVSAALFEDLIDWYLIVLKPALAGKSSNRAFASSCGKECNPKCEYHGNAGFDRNKDGVIYKHEIGAHIDNRVNKYKTEESENKEGSGEAIDVG